MSQSKFKVGDLVRRIQDCGDHLLNDAKGQIALVVAIAFDGDLEVKYLDTDFWGRWLLHMGQGMKTPADWFEPHHAGFTVKLAAPIFTNVDDAIAEATRISAITGTPCEVIAA